MSGLNVNTIGPRTTSNVDFTGVSVPSYSGTPLVTTAGATFTGPIVLPGNAVSALQAVPLQQIASLVGGAQSLTTNGYVTLPGGIIIQWCSTAFVNVASGNPGTTGTVTFPIAYPTACLFCMPATNIDPGGGLSNWNISTVGTPTTTTQDFQVQEWSSGVNPGTALFIAIGY